MGIAHNLHQWNSGARHSEKIYLARAGIKAAYVVSAGFGKPDHAMGIKCYVVWRTGQGQRLAWIAGIRHCERGQVVDLVLSCVGKVVSNVVGVLFREPDGIVGGYQYAHDATAPTGRYHLLKMLSARVKDGKVVLVHFAKPDASLVVDSRPHHATIALRQWVFTKIPRCCDRRKGC